MFYFELIRQINDQRVAMRENILSMDRFYRLDICIDIEKID